LLFQSFLANNVPSVDGTYFNTQLQEEYYFSPSGQVLLSSSAGKYRGKWVVNNPINRTGEITINNKVIELTVLKSGDLKLKYDGADVYFIEGFYSVEGFGPTPAYVNSDIEGIWSYYPGNNRSLDIEFINSNSCLYGIEPDIMLYKFYTYDPVSNTGTISLDNSPSSFSVTDDIIELTDSNGNITKCYRD